MSVQFIKRDDGTNGRPPQDVVIPFAVDFTATAGTPVDGIAFISDGDYELVKVVECHSTAGAGASTLDLKKCTGTTAPASGTTMLATASSFLLDSTANTPIAKVVGGSLTGASAIVLSATSGLTNTQSARRVTAGDRIAYDFTGTLTAYIGVIQLHLRRIQGPNDQIGF